MKPLHFSLYLHAILSVFTLRLHSWTSRSDLSMRCLPLRFKRVCLKLRTHLRVLEIQVLLLTTISRRWKEQVMGIAISWRYTEVGLSFLRTCITFQEDCVMLCLKLKILISFKVDSFNSILSWSGNLLSFISYWIHCCWSWAWLSSSFIHYVIEVLESLSLYSLFRSGHLRFKWLNYGRRKQATLNLMEII